MALSRTRTDGSARKTTRTSRDSRAGERKRLVSALPVKEQRITCAGISTTVLEGGAGPPMLLLHGPASPAVKWLRVIPDLVTTHRVVAPDLPGHGTTDVRDVPLDADRMIDWLDELIDQTCSSKPVLIGQIIGGAIAARFASRRGHLLDRLLLVDALGLMPFSPTPEFAKALQDFVAEPTGETHDRLWHRCVYDLEAIRTALGEAWESLKACNLDRARLPNHRTTQRTLMEQFGMPALAPEELALITVPTTLIWGRQNRATSVQVAEAASNRYGWPLHVIDDAAGDSPLEQPEAFLHAVRATLARP